MVKTRKGISLLTDDQVRAIRAALNSGKNITQQMLAEQYSINQTAISDIKNYKTYKDVH